MFTEEVRLRAIVKDQALVIEDLRLEILRLRAEINNWKDLYRNEVAYCEELQWEDDARNGRLQVGQ